MGNLLAKNFCVLVTGQKQRLVLYVFQVALIKGCVSYDPQRCTADAEMKVPSVEKPELTDVVPFKPGGQNTATHAFERCQEFFFILISTFPVHSPLPFPNPLPTF